MPTKKKGRPSKAKPKKVALTPEEQETRDQVDLCLKDYDMNREQTVKDAWRDVDTISASINTLYKLELMKLPQEVKNMKWDDYFQQALDKGQNPLALSEAISSCLEDSLCATVDTQVSKIKSVIKSTTKSRRGRKTANTENNPPLSATRSSSRNKNSRSASRNSSKTLADSSNLETPANTRKGRSAKNEITTPANTRAPPNKGRTPMITPKFDTSQALSRTVSRVARKDEVLVSLSGSPVVGVTAKATRAEQEQAVLVPLGNGETLCVPMGQDVDTVNHLDQDQLDKLEELQQSLANMLKSRREEESV